MSIEFHLLDCLGPLISHLLSGSNLSVLSSLLFFIAAFWGAFPWSQQKCEQEQLGSYRQYKMAETLLIIISFYDFSFLTFLQLAVLGREIVCFPLYLAIHWMQLEIIGFYQKRQEFLWNWEKLVSYLSTFLNFEYQYLFDQEFLPILQLIAFFFLLPREFTTHGCFAR